MRDRDQADEIAAARDHLEEALATLEMADDALERAYETADDPEAHYPGEEAFVVALLALKTMVTDVADDWNDDG